MPQQERQAGCHPQHGKHAWVTHCPHSKAEACQPPIAARHSLDVGFVDVGNQQQLVVADPVRAADVVGRGAHLCIEESH